MGSAETALSLSHHAISTTKQVGLGPERHTDGGINWPLARRDGSTSPSLKLHVAVFSPPFRLSRLHRKRNPLEVVGPSRRWTIYYKLALSQLSSSQASYQGRPLRPQRIVSDKPLPPIRAVWT